MKTGNFKPYLLRLLVMMLLPFIVTAQSQSGQIDELMTSKHQSGQFNGTVLVAVEGKVMYRKAFGIAEQGRALETDTPFYLGSLAKAFTGMAIMMLAEEGKLSYDSKLNSYLPELPDYTREITIRNLLNHTSGLPDYYDMGKYVDDMTNQMVLKVVLDQQGLEFEPGERYAYSNTAYVLLSLVIERLSGQTFRQFLIEKIFKPLGMAHSEVLDGTQPKLESRATGHTEQGEVDDYQAFTTGAGGIFSQVDNLYLWDQALYSQRLVKKKTLAQAFIPAKLNDGTLSYYGFGWRLNQENPEVIEHSGSLVGFRTYLYRDRRNKNTVILLSNFTNDVSAIKQEIVKIIGE